MRALLSIYLWLIGGLYFGTVAVVGSLLTYIIPREKLDPWLKRWLRFLFRLLFSRVDVEGAEKIDTRTTHLFMANHVSLFDVPLLGATIPQVVQGVEAKEQFSWPIYGWTIRRLGNIPIDRKNIHSSIRSLRKVEKLLQKGRSIIIMPEGHRTLDGKLRPFKKLPFHLAKQADVAIAPIGLSGLYSLKPKGSWMVRPTRLKVKFGNIISLDTVRSLSVQELMDRTRKAIQALVERP